MTRVAVITGASSGIGAAAARAIADEGWHVAVVGRHPERTRAVAESVGGTAFLADYDRLDDVRGLAASLADAYERIDVLANNAGGMQSARALSVDGYERTLQHNHLAPFLLTNLLMPRLTTARIIGTASIGNTFGQLRLDDLEWEGRPWLGGWRPYGTSKIATILFTRSLAERGFEAYSFHPGYVATGFGAEKALVRTGNRLGLGWLALSPEQGAAPLVRLVTDETVPAPSGTYFDRFRPDGRVNRSARIAGIGDALWAESARLVGLAAAASSS
ncbi:SDR family NAD(P)-dependent oxidoreductase [Leifsonia sp. H3M29-4]|uniref:SDR family NAD(P)-dependent oxidoreductase n=1 Tax=Salinibacterium metalliresistens TaxID=3031321 RepID=UPI0023DB453A|nr:SDR family NAD(P)-dependent oxidoreductase [Salinibacterium metalliresistens]MDF1479690.1 SDR family NAD(P)-dependent oxidoreductase [Salinibacterium metalliresistens]